MTSQEDFNPEEHVLDERTVLNASADQLSAPASQHQLLSEGQILAGKYKIQGYVGSGGMSVVYKARDQLLSRDVAIKMLSASRVSDEKSVRRFQQEGTAVGRLNHQNIVSVYDVGVTENGEPFLVMDFAHGKTLNDLVSFSGRCSPLRAMRLIENVLDALEHAHEKGVVHRDLKPSNIIVANPGQENEYARVFDFGIAKLMPGSDTTNAELTQTGEIFGSPLYMSPEQCLGKPLDGRSDIYSVGCILFELLVGHPPHRAETTVETIIKHVQEDVLSLNESCPGAKFSRELEETVQKALAKDPAQRYQTAKEMKQVIASLLTDARGEQPLMHAKSKLFGVLDKDPISLSVAATVGFFSLILIGTLIWSFATSITEKDKPIRAELSSGTLRHAVDEAQIQTEARNGVQDHVEQSFNFPDGIAQFSFVDVDDTVVGKLVNTRNVTTIDFKFGKITASKMILTYFSKITADTLNISGATFNIDFLEAVGRMRYLQCLEINELKHPLTEEEIDAISHSVSLQKLSLNKSISSDEALRPLSRLPALTFLSVANCNLSSESLVHLSKCAKLRELRLADDHLRGKGLRVLSLLPELSVLDLSRNEFTDSEMRELAYSTGLKSLRLEACPITDSGLMALTKLKKLSFLQVNNCRVTRRGVSRFKAALPSCKVIF